MADDDKKNPWWEYTDDEEGEGTIEGTIEEEKGGDEGEEDEVVSKTPATLKLGGPQGPGPTDPTIMGNDFTATPPTIMMPGAPGAPASQQYAPMPPAMDQPGMPGSFAQTPPTMGGFQSGYGSTQGLPVMPGTMPGTAETPMGPGQETVPTQYQQLQLSELGAGIPYATQGGNLGLLLDVPVPITVVLGRSVMRIQEVLGLQPGSVVTLDRNDAEPVDLLIKDKLIAQGEVVVIDGNYGIKITKIIEPEQRMKDLG